MCSKKIKPQEEAIAACIRGTIADAATIQRAAKAEAAAKGKTLELRDPTPADVGELIPLEAWPHLFRMAKKDAREGVRAVIEGKKSRDELTAGNLLLSMVENYLIATATDYESGRTFPEAARANAEALAELLKIAPAAMLNYCEGIGKRIEADREQYFPAMKPSPGELLKKAADRLNTAGLTAITQQFMLKQPEKREVFSHWKGDIYLPFIQDEAKSGQWQTITISEWKDSAGNEVELSAKYPPEVVGCITPFDQVVENAISRLYKRYIEEKREPDGLGFTLEQIFCEMAGNTNATRPSIPMLEKIYVSCEKLRQTKIRCTAKNTAGGGGFEGDVLPSIVYWITPKKGKKKIGYKVYDEGLLTRIEKSFWDPLNIPAEVLNIGEGEHGVSITETSLVIARFLMQEVFRIKKSEYLTPESRTISLARIIDYEAAEALTEYQNELPIILHEPGKMPKHQPKQSAGASPKEQEAIRNARRHRRELAGRILAGWAEKGFIKSARLNEDKSGFIIDVEKTEKAAKRIEHRERQTRKQDRLTAAADRKNRKKGGPQV